MRKVLVISLIVLAFCTALAMVGHELRGRHMRGAKAIRLALGIALLAVYAYGILSQTILGRTAGARSANLELLWSYRAALALTEDGIDITNAYLLSEILLNVLLFVPMGALLPFLAPSRFGTGRIMRGIMLVATIAFACSCAIEVYQLHFRLGLFEFDDMLNNVFGALLGFATYRSIGRLARWLTSASRREA